MSVKDSDGDAKIIPSRKQMEIIAKQKQNMDLIEKK